MFVMRRLGALAVFVVLVSAVAARGNEPSNPVPSPTKLKVTPAVLTLAGGVNDATITPVNWQRGYYSSSGYGYPYRRYSSYRPYYGGYYSRPYYRSYYRPYYSGYSSYSPYYSGYSRPYYYGGYSRPYYTGYRGFSYYGRGFSGSFSW